MSEVMTPMSFEQLVDWVLQEKKKRGTVFGQHHAYRADGTHNRTMFGRTLETPIGLGFTKAKFFRLEQIRKGAINNVNAKKSETS